MVHKVCDGIVGREGLKDAGLQRDVGDAEHADHKKPDEGDGSNQESDTPCPPALRNEQHGQERNRDPDNVILADTGW